MNSSNLELIKFFWALLKPSFREQNLLISDNCQIQSSNVLTLPWKQACLQDNSIDISRAKLFCSNIGCVVSWWVCAHGRTKTINSLSFVNEFRLSQSFNGHDFFDLMVSNAQKDCLVWFHGKWFPEPIFLVLKEWVWVRWDWTVVVVVFVVNLRQVYWGRWIQGVPTDQSEHP